MAKRLGATDTVDASSSDAVDEIRKLTGGAGVDYSFKRSASRVSPSRLSWRSSPAAPRPSSA